MIRDSRQAIYGSYWLPLAAIGMVLWLVGVHPVYGGARDHAAATNNQPKPSDDSGPRDTVAIQHLVERTASALEGIENKIPAQDDSGKRSADAAQDAAYWAFWMVIIAGADTVVTAGGVLLIFWTLREARRSANETQRQAIAAEKSLELAKLTSENELRAWIDVEVFLREYRRSAETVTFVVGIKLLNVGRTPAPKTWISHNIRAANSIVINGGDAPAIDPCPQTMTPLLPNGFVEQNIQLWMDYENVKQVIRTCRGPGSSIMGIIDVIAYYKTVFDAPEAEKHMTSVRYYVHPPKAEADGLTWMLEGPIGTSAVSMVQDNSAPAFVT